MHKRSSSRVSESSGSQELVLLQPSCAPPPPPSSPPPRSPRRTSRRTAPAPARWTPSLGFHTECVLDISSSHILMSTAAILYNNMKMQRIKESVSGASGVKDLSSGICPDMSIQLIPNGPIFTIKRCTSGLAMFFISSSSSWILPNSVFKSSLFFLSHSSLHLVEDLLHSRVDDEIKRS